MKFHRNGFMTYTVLALGLSVLSVALVTARLALQEVRQAEAFYAAVRGAYEAESVLLMSCDNPDSLPAGGTREVHDIYGISEKGDVLGVGVQRFATGKTVLRAYAVTAEQRIGKTCAVKFGEKDKDMKNNRIEWIWY